MTLLNNIRRLRFHILLCVSGAWYASGAAGGRSEQTAHIPRCAPGRLSLITAQSDRSSAAPVKPYGTILPPPSRLLQARGREDVLPTFTIVLSWVVCKEYFYPTAPFPEKRGVHHKVSLTLGEGRMRLA